MKKIPLILTTAALMLTTVAVVGNKQMKAAKATDDTISYVPTSTSKLSNDSTGSITMGDYTWDYQITNHTGSVYSDLFKKTLDDGNYKYFNQFGSSKNRESVSFTTDEIPGVIKSVSVECGSSKGAHKISISVGENTYLASTSTSSWTSYSTKSGSGTSSGKITINLAGGSGSDYGALYIGNITVVYENGNPATYESCKVSGGEINGHFKGIAYADNTATITGENNPSQAVNWSVTTSETYSATTNSTTATIDSKGRVTFLDNGTVYVWATSSKSASCHNTIGYKYEVSGLIVTSFTKAKSLDTLYNGQIIVIGNTTGNKVIGGVQGSNNRSAVSSTCSSDVISPVDGFEVITLGIEEMENGDIVYTFNTDDGYLLTTESASSNVLRSGSLDNSARWTITISTSGTATISNYKTPAKLIKYNANNGSALFNCYSSGQEGVSIYTDITVSSKQQAETFVIRYMKPVSVPNTDTGTGKCISESWYTKAKTAFNALSEEVRRYISLNFSEAFVRLSTWADKNGDQMSDITIVSGSKMNIMVTNSNLIYAVIGSFAIATTAGIFFLTNKKRKLHK